MVEFENGAGTKKSKRREDIKEIEELYIVKIRYKEIAYICVCMCSV